MENSKLYSKNEVNILVIDDNKMNLELISEVLDNDGFEQLTLLSNPLEVQKTIVDQAFDLILLDINMPILDGFGVLSFLQQNLQNDCPPVLMVTAQGDVENRIRAFDEGASDYITKPFNRQELINRIHVHIENWKLRKQLEHEKATLDDRVRRRTNELMEAQLEVVNRLGRAGEYRDNETGNHVKRVSLISKMLAEKIGCDSNFCELVHLAAPMHDIGKMGISDTILLKPGKLTEEEYAIMQTHVEIGADIIAGSTNKIMKFASEIILTHHEKYNGKGYPKQLAGEDIPLAGRIVALADVYDALTSVRPYKKAWTPEDALELVIREKGQHFDPQLVEAFIELFDEIQSVSNQYSDET